MYLDITMNILTSNPDFEKKLNSPWSSEDDEIFEYLFRIYIYKEPTVKWHRKMIASIYPDIDSLHPNSERLREQINKKYLAERVLQCENLLKVEKEEIYFLLTGEKPHIRSKGSSNFVIRDLVMTIEYLFKIYKSPDVNDTRSVLGVKYGVREENTFYKAINRGLDYLKSLADCGKVHTGKNNTISETESTFSYFIYELILDSYGRDCIEKLTINKR